MAAASGCGPLQGLLFWAGEGGLQGCRRAFSRLQWWGSTSFSVCSFYTLFFCA